jgi:GTP cyclohydrolase I
MSDTDHVKLGDRQYIWLEDVKALLVKLFPQDDFAHPELERTPERWVRMMVELSTPEPFEFTVFNSLVDEIVVVQDIPFVALCAHHLVPFIGTCHVGYVPNGKIAGLSKFARLVQHHAKGLWNQESLNNTIAIDLEQRLQPQGVAVIMSAEHLCMTIRGVQTPGTRTTTSSMRGVFADHSRQARAEFLSLLRLT